MAYEIKLLDLIDIELDASFLVLGRGMGTLEVGKTWGCLILGGDDPILVDTGAANAEIVRRLGMVGTIEPEMALERQLAEHGVAMSDVRWVLHTHHHIDHAGQDDRLPRATLITNRRELEFSASGIMGAQYPPEYVRHHIDRLHMPGAMRLLDLELSGPVEVFPGIVCEAAGGHTEGSMNIRVETREGTACICGDVVYDIEHQLVDPYHELLADEPRTTGNHSMSKRHEKAAIKRALNGSAFLVPMHDYPAQIEDGRVSARLGRAVPGRRTEPESQPPRVAKNESGSKYPDFPDVREAVAGPDVRARPPHEDELGRLLESLGSTADTTKEGR
jgi:glyoxylase-like metal-dependent hydrolase (beta-lactamase superfamily II)